jgi:glycosyltransferase involved in cell wall biosynthesis
VTANRTDDGGLTTEDRRPATDEGPTTDEEGTTLVAGRRSPVLGRLEGRDIVLLYGPPWDQTARVSKHHLTSYLAQHNRVLFVESPPHSLTLVRRPLEAPAILRRALAGPRLVEHNVWVQSLFNPVPYHSVSAFTGMPVMNLIGQRAMAPALKRALRRLGFKRPMFILGLPQALDLIEGIPRSGLVYHCADDYAEVSVFPPSFVELEQRLLQSADVVITTAEPLRVKKAPWNANTFAVPNGVSFDHFHSARDESTRVPADLLPIPRPIIGFVGGVAEWLDLKLIADIARRRKDWSIVLIGPILVDVSILRDESNILLLGPRPYATLPGYLKGIDVATIPFLMNELTRNADPIKLYEYLAAGLPVVSTDMPQVRRLHPVIEVTDSAEAFERAVERALEDRSESTVAARVAEARKHAWSKRFARVEALIAEHARSG